MDRVAKLLKCFSEEVYLAKINVKQGKSERLWSGI